MQQFQCSADDICTDEISVRHHHSNTAEGVRGRRCFTKLVTPAPRHSHANLGTTRLQFCINICLTLFSGFDRVVSSWMHFTQRVLCERSIRPYVPLPEKSQSKAGLETYNSLPSIRPFRKGIYL